MSSSQSPKTYLFVDGSNLYGSQYELFGPEKYLNFAPFILQLQLSLKTSFTKIYFYASYSPKKAKLTKKEVAYLKNEGLFYRSVKDTPGVEFFKGYRSKTSGKEKEVDVKLAVDMVDFAHRNKYHAAYLISGDADFLHALFAVGKLKKQVRLTCMSNNIMYKAMYYFPTYILHINNKENIAGSTAKSPINLNLPLKEIINSV
jgi:uncharacterized LabA/DUF88 family protein